MAGFQESPGSSPAKSPKSPSKVQQAKEQWEDLT